MKPEQTKQLKPGDTIFIRSSFIKADDGGNIVFSCKYRCGVLTELTNYAMAEEVFSPSDLQQPAEKTTCAPGRKFRKGDIVRLRAYNGRTPYDYWHKQPIKNFGKELDTVYEDEKEDSGHVDIFQDAPIDELMVRVHSSFLELVTPVDELEPYRIGKSDFNGFVNIEKAGQIIWMLPYGKERHEFKTEAEAKAAAEAECYRLNAEYKKAREKAVNEPNLSC